MLPNLSTAGPRGNFKLVSSGSSTAAAAYSGSFIGTDLFTGWCTKEAQRRRDQPSDRTTVVALARRRLPKAWKQRQGQEALPPSHSTRLRCPQRGRLRRLPVDGPRRQALHRPGGDALGDLEREHDGQGEVVLPPGRNRNSRKAD